MFPLLFVKFSSYCLSFSVQIQVLEEVSNANEEKDEREEEKGGKRDREQKREIKRRERMRGE